MAELSELEDFRGDVDHLCDVIMDAVREDQGERISVGVFMSAMSLLTGVWAARMNIPIEEVLRGVGCAYANDIEQQRDGINH